MRISEQMRETMISLRNFRAASNARNPLPARSAPFRKIGSSGYARILSKIGALRHALRAIRSWSNRRATRAQPGQRRATREPAFSYRNMRKMFFFQCGLVPLPPARVVSAVIKHQVYRGAKPGSLDGPHKHTIPTLHTQLRGALRYSGCTDSPVSHRPLSQVALLRPAGCEVGEQRERRSATLLLGPVSSKMPASSPVETRGMRTCYN